MELVKDAANAVPPLRRVTAHILRGRNATSKYFRLWILSTMLVLYLLPGLMTVVTAEDGLEAQDTARASCDSDMTSSRKRSSRGISVGGSRFLSRKRGTAGKHVLMVSINELSHIKPLTALARELLQRGHHITFVAPESCLLNTAFTSTDKFATEAPCQIDTKGWMSKYLPKATFVSAGVALTSAEKEAATPRDLRRAVLYALHTVSDVNEALLTRLLRTFSPASNSSGGMHGGEDEGQVARLPAPDMMVADFLTTAAVDAAEALGVPLIANNPFPICHDLTEPQGILVPVHAFPAPLRSLTTFKGRIANLINHFLWLGVGLYAARLRNLTRSKHGLPALPCLEQMAFRGSALEARAWILQNTVFGLEIPRVVDPRTHMLGPLLLPFGGEACTPGKAERDCRAALKWLGKGRSERPVLYVGLAEALTPAPMPVTLAAMKALASDQIGQHYDVLWVLDEESRLRLDRPVPVHMLVVTAVNQRAVLSHPRAALVLAQPALGLISEVLWHGLPVLGLPLRSYDRGACTLAQDAGAAVCLPPSGPGGWPEAENLVRAIWELAPPPRPPVAPSALDPSFSFPGRPSNFRAQARRLAIIMHASGGVARAADLVELGMRVGLAHLQRPSLDIGFGMGSSWLGGSMVDVRLVLFLILLLCYWTLALSYRLGRRLHKWWSVVGRKAQGVRGVSESDRAQSVLQQHQYTQSSLHNGGRAMATSAPPPFGSLSPAASSQAPLSPAPPALAASSSTPNMMMPGGSGGEKVTRRGGDATSSPSSERNMSGRSGGGRGGGEGGGGAGNAPRDRPPLPPRMTNF